MERNTMMEEVTMSGRKKLRGLIPLCGDFLVSSDMHNTTSRATEMKQAYRIAKKRWPDDADGGFFVNAERLLSEKREPVTAL